MTDKERAEKYLHEIVGPKRLEPTVLNANREIVNAHIAGLAEGRKLGKEEQWLATEKAQKKTSARIKELEKEIEVMQEGEVARFESFNNRITELEKENAELKKNCDFNCPVHKLATHNTCLFCSAVRNSPYRDLKNVTDEELQKIIKDAEAEMD